MFQTSISKRHLEDIPLFLHYHHKILVSTRNDNHWTRTSTRGTQPSTSSPTMNGYTSKEIKRDMRPRRKHITQEESTFMGKAFLPYTKNVIGKILKAQHIYQPTTKLRSMFISTTDKQHPLTLVEFTIYSECAEVYIGTTKKSTDTRIKQHERHYRLELSNRSTVALQHGHDIKFYETTCFLVNTRKPYYKRLHKHNNNFSPK